MSLGTNAPSGDLRARLARLGIFAETQDIQLGDDQDNAGYVLINLNRTVHGNASVGLAYDRSGVDPNLYVVTVPGKNGAVLVLADAGVGIPHITQAARDAIPTSGLSQGATIFNQTSQKLNFWDGAAWRVVTST